MFMEMKYFQKGMTKKLKLVFLKRYKQSRRLLLPPKKEETINAVERGAILDKGSKKKFG